MEIKICLDEILLLRNKTRYWLSRETGITYPAIVKLCEQKTNSISFESLAKLCKCLKVEVGDILIYQDEIDCLEI